MMIICVGCRVEMRCHKNGAVVQFGPVYNGSADQVRGDAYVCPRCGGHVVYARDSARYYGELQEPPYLEVA